MLGRDGETELSAVVRRGHCTRPGRVIPDPGGITSQWPR
ncbi:hypothetical protein I553_1967 [Mycobacterium xenopi 4042]|uniref:Uncharacterized protein n=1 Tax=Mycobacterium xenopi 4042 TaxID=1299334 RepID=X8DK99_MYCXE|nr:hypothetical protein I553_1967 [Mycobacterium xenopi 4042]